MRNVMACLLGVAGAVGPMPALAQFVEPSAAALESHEFGSVARHPGHDRSGGAGNAQSDGHGVETESLFGFTAGSDTEDAGAVGLALEAVGRLGKRDGSYAAIGKKLELSYGVTDDVSVALGLFTSYHDIAGVPGLEDLQRFDFNGIGGELRWRLMRRGPSPLGVTVQIEPSWQTHDELTGEYATKFGAENKLIFDTELLKDRVFAAFNLLYELEHVRERWSDEVEKASKVGFAAALSVQVLPQSQTFIGGELRYLRAYDGLLPETFAGEALFLGPTLYSRLGESAWISAAWNVQVAGHEAGHPAPRDLTNFERHNVRLKVGREF